MKKQTDFTFDEAKNAALHHLSSLAIFAENMQNQFGNRFHIGWIVVLRELEERVRKASGPCLSDLDIKHVWELAQQLIQANPELNSQLSQFWNLYHEVLEILSSKIDLPGYYLQNVISRLMPRIKLADTLSESIVSAAKSNVSNILSATGLLLMHIIRTETFEYTILKQLKDAIESHDLVDKYDVYLICSVQNKVSKGQGWRTDVRAIRDSTAHGHFKVHSLGDDWEIEFDHNEEGYNFHKRFSRKQFTKFIDLHTMLVKFQLHLLIIIELLPILATHFHKRS